jgi:REP element-mobilizing transposase RayT
MHFITASCYHREPLLRSPRRSDLLLKVLEQVRVRYGFVVIGYVVMPEHFHLLISEPEKANPSVVMQALKLGVVRRLFPRKQRSDPGAPRLFQDMPAQHFWQRRFYDFNVWSAQARRETSLHASQPGQTRTGGDSRPVAVEHLPILACGETGLVIVNDWSVLNPKLRAS